MLSGLKAGKSNRFSYNMTKVKSRFWAWPPDCRVFKCRHFRGFRARLHVGLHWIAVTFKTSLHNWCAQFAAYVRRLVGIVKFYTAAVCGILHGKHYCKIGRRRPWVVHFLSCTFQLWLEGMLFIRHEGSIGFRVFQVGAKVNEYVTVDVGGSEPVVQ